MVWIKSVTIQGFKSFEKRTVIKLPLGLVVITGPNGGGKSTVLDAVKFALGELSAQNLRVDRFSKLLHESSRGTGSQAVVTLTLDNTDHTIPIDSEEVIVSRRLHYTGESEYLLNGRTVSRNELLTILSAANIKPDGLNLVTQGSVVGIAEMTSKEVREVLEDAAGISGYKKRRDDAFKELEVAQKNIDIAKAATAEVRSRVKQLELERNQLLRKTLLEKIINNIKSASLLNESKNLKQALTELESKAAEITEKISAIQNESERVQSQISTIKTELEELRKTRDQLDNEIHGLDREIYSIESEKARKASEIKTAENSLRQAAVQQELVRERITRWQARISQLVEHNQAKAAEAEKAYTSWVEVENEVASLRKEAESMRQILEEVESKYSSRLEELRFLKLSEDGKSLLIENLRKQIANKQAEKKEAENQLVDNKEKQTELINRLEALNNEIEEVSKKLASFEAEFESLKNSATDWMKKVSEIERAMEEARVLKASLIQLLDTLRTEHKRESSARNLKTVRDVYSGRISSWEKAVLGDWLNAVVVDDYKEAVSLASLAVENGVPVKIVAELKDLDSLIRTLACGAMPKRATSVKDLTHLDRNVATVDGVYVNANRLINVHVEQGDNTTAERLTSYIEKISSIEERLSHARQFISDKLKENEEKTRNIQSAEAELKKRLQAAVLEKTKIETELNSVNKVVESLTRRIKLMGEEIAKIESEKERLERLLAEKTDQLGELRALKTEVERIRAEYKKVDDSIRQKSLQVSALYRAYVDLERAKDSIAVELNSLKDSISNAEKELASLNELNQKLEDEIKKLEQVIASLDQKVETVKERRKQLEERRTLVSSEISQKSRLLEQLEHEFSNLKWELSSLEKENNNLAIERVRIETSLKSLNERLQSLTSVNDEEAVMPAELLQPLENELAEIPAVNQLAVMQYDGIIENYRLRSSRINELELERKRILDLIESINREEAEAFQRALDKVSASFGFYFNQLTGGEGFLRLENPSEPLSSGVEMVVKFVGKQARSTVSISGGEKSVSAVSLILALQDLTPAQFYVFDEIDAHLDVVYVKNLVNLLKKMSTKKQIIIITLKDIVAEQADALFGVYMVNESSQVVRTRLDEVVEVGK
ncbi:MAG: chromosome segregation protein SMC [Candidatus Caldarchaeum sp.]|nr:chromosome segregation protein SMC [Candidatus Caldarchaeum sp.]